LNRAQLPGRPDDLSNLMIYDFETDEVTLVHPGVVQQAGLRSPSEGLADYLPSGHIMVEEENSGRILIIAPDGTLAAEFINSGSDGKAYHLGWSRYIGQEDGDVIRQAVDGVDCS
ncbi:MAG: hypothetical protein WBB85_08465, partial [Albidovulum sp.]|uniref:hypothetical protein n=1 Tax=Albidovulum sp. TaxID=1872424 RepID=UPI003C997867